MEIQGRIIKTGSSGNCVIFDNRIAIDCGIPYKDIEPYKKSLQVIFYTHVSHSDHYNKSTLRLLQFERPALRVGCSGHDSEILKANGVKNIDVLNIGQLYDYASFKVCPIKMYHDVPCIGFRLFINGKKIFFATDTFTLEGIVAKNYDEYYCECNYDKDRIMDIIKEKRDNGQFCHQLGSVNSHLSIQQAQNFVLQNAGKDYEFIRLHQSKEF